MTYRLWFYFDENAESPYDDSYKGEGPNELYRQDKILVDYYNSKAAYDNGNGTPTTADREFMFRQMNLWTINGHITNTQYGIEYFEEYLYNYAADDNFGVTTDGMAWGLDGEQLSSQYQAIYTNPEDMEGLLTIIVQIFGGDMSNYFNTAFAGVNAKYDFYLSRDNIAEPRDYKGLDFTYEIANQAGIVDHKVTLSQNASSAVEYCYNKNKRNDDGEVETIHWYLPAIDETEEILVDGFNYFPVFQSKWYWSSQPAFDKINYTAEFDLLWGILTSTASGAYYRDDLDRARATRVTATSNYEDSGVTNAIASRNITIEGQDDVTLGVENPTNLDPGWHAGNRERKEINRVRCAYSQEGKKAVNYPLKDIIGTWSVGANTSASGDGTPVTVTISKSDDPSKGNVVLSNYIHRTYHNTSYPQYANYDTKTGQLSIPMNQKVGVYTYRNNNYDVYSVLYESNNRANVQTLVLEYDNTTGSFTVSGGSNYNLRGSYTRNNTTQYINDATYIRSFTKQ